jgi:thiol-disulfide isomerase/thioredoxin
MTFRPARAVAAAALTATIMLGAGTAAGPATASPTLAPLISHSDWLAARPTESDLRGRVVLVDIFTFGCFNCKNVTPNLRALYRRHDDRLAIIGIHTPETPYESDRKNVVANLASLGIVWPVAIDNDRALWNAYDTEYWPTQLIFDKHGTLRKTIVGDSQDQDVDDTVTKLLAES